MNIQDRMKILVRAPVLTQSGYGEHARFLLRSLRKYEHMIDMYVVPINWGNTNWIAEDSEERAWYDQLIGKTQNYINNKGTFNMSIQVTIPNEWEKLAEVNIGVTAGIETNKVAPEWIQKSKLMDRIIVPSFHAKRDV